MFKEYHAMWEPPTEATNSRKHVKIRKNKHVYNQPGRHIFQELSFSRLNKKRTWEINVPLNFSIWRHCCSPSHEWHLEFNKMFDFISSKITENFVIIITIWNWNNFLVDFTISNRKLYSLPYKKSLTSLNLFSCMVFFVLLKRKINFININGFDRVNFFLCWETLIFLCINMKYFLLWH